MRSTILCVLVALALTLCGCEALGGGDTTGDASEADAPNVSITISPVVAYGSDGDIWSESGGTNQRGNSEATSEGAAGGNADGTVSIPPPPEPVASLMKPTLAPDPLEEAKPGDGTPSGATRPRGVLAFLGPDADCPDGRCKLPQPAEPKPPGS